MSRVSAVPTCPCVSPRQPHADILGFCPSVTDDMFFLEQYTTHPLFRLKESPVPKEQYLVVRGDVFRPELRHQPPARALTVDPLPRQVPLLFRVSAWHFARLGLRE